MLARAPLPAGKKPEPRRANRLLAAAIPLAQRSAVELQHDVKILGRWGDEQMFGAK